MYEMEDGRILTTPEELEAELRQRDIELGRQQCEAEDALMEVVSLKEQLKAHRAPVAALERIDKLEWIPKEQDPDCWQWKGEYDGRTVFIIDQEDGNNYHEIDLPPDVVLARIVQRPTAQYLEAEA